MIPKLFRLRKRSGLFLLASATLLLAGLPATPLHAGDGARVVKYAKEDVVPVRAKLRYSTLLVLPDNEEILDFTTGDKEFWIINGAHNLCYIHPAQAGIRSNLNLITASGRVYSFLLTEISSDRNAEPDLKLFIEPKETSGTLNLQGYARASEAEAYKKELETLRVETEARIRAAETSVGDQVNRFRSEYAGKLQFDYTLDAKAHREPFLVSAIFHDDAFTYIQCGAREKPALYEVKDGKPNRRWELAGIVPAVIRQQMGHTTAAMTSLYSGEIPIEQVKAEFSMKNRLGVVQLEKMENEAAA